MVVARRAGWWESLDFYKFFLLEGRIIRPSLSYSLCAVKIPYRMIPRA